MASTSRICRLHIGAPKTGSTALQAFCAENRQTLLDQGVLYPEVSLRGFGHHDLAFLLAGGYPDWATPQPRPLGELLDELAAAAAAHDGDLFLSSENFYLLADPALVRQGLERAGVFHGREPRIQVYLRRQDEAQASWYNQTIKAQGYAHSFAECLAAFSGLFDYAARLRPWAEVFGAANLEVRVYEPGRLPGGDIRLDFLQALGLAPDGFRLPPKRPNVEINADLLEFQRLVNRLPLTPQEKRSFHKQLMELSTRSAGSGLFTEGPPLDLPRRREILAASAAGNAEVARLYLGREELFAPLDEGAAPPAAQGRLTEEKLAGILGWILINRPSA